MKYISFSLFGTAPKYCVGACKNAILARYWYPDYKCVFWIDNTVPRDVSSYLTQAGAEVRQCGEAHSGMFQRFLINDDSTCERYLIRDTDSRIGEREVTAVRAWEKNGKQFHVIRDHPHHKTIIPGGLWGAVKGAIPSMAELLRAWTGPLTGYDSDQQFLRQLVWPLVSLKALQHDSFNLFPGSVPLPVAFAFDNPRFCGEVFDAMDRPRSYDWEKILMHVQPPRSAPELFVRPHLGLGDMFILNALIRALAQKHETILVPVKHRNLLTVRQMWSDLNNVSCIGVENDAEADAFAKSHKGPKLSLGMFGDKWNEGKPGWDKLFYTQARIPFEQRWDGFKVGHRSVKEHKVERESFALIHEDAARGFVIDNHRRPTIPSFTIWPSGSMFDFLWMLENAEEIHVIDSSVAILVDSIETKAKKLVLHLYARKGAKPPTYRKPWEILTK